MIHSKLFKFFFFFLVSNEYIDNLRKSIYNTDLRWLINDKLYVIYKNFHLIYDSYIFKKKPY